MHSSVCVKVTFGNSLSANAIFCPSFVSTTSCVSDCSAAPAATVDSKNRMTDKIFLVIM